MGLLETFQAYEKTVQHVRSEYQKYEKIFLEDQHISKEEHAKLDQLADQLKQLEAVLDDKKLEQTILHVKKEVDKGDEKSTIEALGLLGNTLSQVSAQSKQAAKAALEAIFSAAKLVLANVSADNAVKDVEHDCGDYWAEGNPLVRISYYSPSCKVQFANLKLSSRAPYMGEWIRENASHALFEGFSKRFSYRVDRIFKTPEWLGEALGLSETALQEYTGLWVRYRIKGETILLHNWYGKYKYDFCTGNLLAVEFRGKGEEHLVLGAPFVLEYGLFDHNGVLVDSLEEKGAQTIGIDIDSYTVLPETSSGKF